MASAAAASDAGDHAVLREDERGIPRSLRSLAAFVEAEARHFAAAATRPSEINLVRAFRGGATPQVSVGEFMERIHLSIRSRIYGHVIRIDGTCYVLAAVYLIRFIRSPAALEAGFLVEPATAHRIVAVALFLGAKFGGHAPRRWTAVFEACSGRAIRAREMANLEQRFLRAIGFRLFVDGEEFARFSRILEQGPPAPRGSRAGTKRQAAAVVGEEDERRRVRPYLPPPAVASN